MLPTRNHEEIRRWVEDHDGVPAEVKPLLFDSIPTVLHILFGKEKNGTPEIHPITWEDFFARFDLMGLAMAFDEHSREFDIVRVEPNSPPRTLQALN